MNTTKAAQKRARPGAPMSSNRAGRMLTAPKSSGPGRATMPPCWNSAKLRRTWARPLPKSIPKVSKTSFRPMRINPSPRAANNIVCTSSSHDGQKCQKARTTQRSTTKPCRRAARLRTSARRPDRMRESSPRPRRIREAVHMDYLMASSPPVLLCNSYHVRGRYLARQGNEPGKRRAGDSDFPT